MSEKSLRKTLEEACFRLGLIFTAEKRGFGMAYIQGCAKAGCEEIEAALTASPILEEPGFQKALVNIAEHVISRWHQTVLQDARLPSLIAELDYCKDKVKKALAASPALEEPDLREALKRYGRHDDTCLRRQIGVFSADPECDCGLDAILSALAVSFAPSTPAVQTGEREKEASG